MSETEFEVAVRKILEQTKPGDLLTYGELATEAGFPGAARAVGNYLRQAGEPLPWWRVVNSRGRLHPNGSIRQAELLAKESTMCENGYIKGWK